MLWFLFCCCCWLLLAEAKADYSSHQLIYLSKRSLSTPLRGLQAFPFHFGRSYTFAYEHFTFTGDGYYRLTVWDCFCPGDRFNLYINGVQAFDVQEIYTPQPVGSENCGVYVEDPENCLALEIYPALIYDFPLVGATMNISIQVRYSVYGAGVGYLMLTEQQIQ